MGPRLDFRKKLVLRIIRLARFGLRNTTIHKWKLTTKIYRTLFESITPESHVEVEFRGSTFIMETRDVSIAPTVMTGQYEQMELDVLENILQRGMSFVDVGANIGLYTVLAAKHVGPSGKVWAYEPVPNNFDLLQRNVMINALGHTILRDVAVGAHPGKMPIFLSPQNTGTHSGIPSSHASMEVECVTLDDEVDDEVHVIKIDVEGFEGAVLSGAYSLIRNHRPTIFLEFIPELLSQSSYGPDVVLSILDEIYPYLYSINERNGALVPTTSSDLRRARSTNLVASIRPLN